ncbi:cysteine hydrolase family protein [Reinekea blandensis]|uniref:Amidase from nicotinamidase family protein n=1 Tax=Reinekea blandensis MED297 TaxID=314283 RepID=A4BBH0_9GAMM|nr:isochorismatase family cysteine hydrolase [Reinekea blandensis]EAR10305.1 Amidase from nicotinamidase family protein [Reinekea sp. MED297] [Reinekea blandensis MED297]
MNSALLIIDMQNGFLNEYPDKSDIPGAIEVINYVADLMRKGGQTVIHIRDVGEADFMSEEDLDIHPDIQQDPADLHLEKTYSNAFHNTKLAQRLAERNIKFLILAGQAAEHCVVFTYNGASENQLTATVLQDGVISAKTGRSQMLMEDRNIISHAAIRALIPNA